MLNIKKNAEEGKLTLGLEGRLDTLTVPQLEAELKASLNGVKELVMDLTELQYVSSAGLRVLLSAQKKMNEQGSMIVQGVSEEVMEIFDITGFCDILTIK